MVDNVIELPIITTLDVPPKRILRGAKKAALTDVIVIGYEPNGEFYFASSKADGGDVLWLLELAKRRLMETADDLEKGA